MLVLAIDTSSDKTSAALVRENRLLGELTLKTQDDYLKHVLVIIDYLLKSEGVSVQDIDLYSVVTGPGTWSGLRIGVVTAKSLAFTLGKPIVGVPTLDVLASGFRFTQRPVYSVIDARRGEVYFAGYRCDGEIPERFTEYSLAGVDELMRRIRTPAILVGEIAVRYQERLVSTLGGGLSVAGPSLSSTRGALVAELGLARFTTKGPDDQHSLAPLYLREELVDGLPADDLYTRIGP